MTKTYYIFPNVGLKKVLNKVFFKASGSELNTMETFVLSLMGLISITCLNNT